jgi:uncharacterized membrane protein
MNPFVMSVALGAISGSRSMLAPALVARAAGVSRGAPLLATLAGGEMLADKLPFIPARTRALPLVGRLASGAVVGSAFCAGRSRVACAIGGAAGAVVAAYALTRVRQFVTTQRGVPNAVAGLCEDAVALAAGLWLLRRVPPSRSAVLALQR